MKTAATASIWQGLAKYHDKKYSWQDIVIEAKQAGYTGVELGGNEDSMGPAQKVLDFMDSQDMEISAWFMSVTYNPWEENTVSYEKSIDYAAKLNVEIMCCCGGFIPNQRRNTDDADYDMFAGNLGNAIEYAKRFGIEVAFHPHRGCIVENIAETKKMIDRLPDLKICIDTAHLEAVKEDSITFIRTFGKKIIATHIKDYSWELDSFIEPGLGDGKLNVDEAVSELVKAGYNRWLTIELDKQWEKVEEKPSPAATAVVCRNFLRKCGY